MREPIPTWAFSVVVVKLGRRFLVVKEKKHGQRWYLPAGRVDPGESFVQAAIRETREESGLEVVLEGILRIEHSPKKDGARLRVLFLARPADDTAPKSVADDESLEARWVTVEELADLPQRGQEVSRLFADILGGAPLYPLSILQDEGRPLR